MNSSDVIAEHAQHALMKQLVDRFGERFLSDPALCRSVLSDHGSSFSKREIHALTGAVSLGLPVKLQTSAGSAGGWSLQRQVIADRMHEEIGLNSELALWGADLWAIATSTIAVSEIRRVGSAGSDLNNAEALGVSNGCQTGAPKNVVLTPGANRLMFEIVKFDLIKDESVIDIQLKVDNSTSLNFTAFALEVTMFDSDGDMIENTYLRVGRIKPQSLTLHHEKKNYSGDAIPSSILVKVGLATQVDGEDIEFIAMLVAREKDVSIYPIPKSTELIVTTSMSALNVRRSRVALLDSLV